MTASVSSQRVGLAAADLTDARSKKAVVAPVSGDVGAATIQDVDVNFGQDDNTASVFSVIWVALLCVFVDFLGLSISIPVLPYLILELPWDESTSCPRCPQDAIVIDFASEGRCGEVDGCGTSFDVGLSLSAFYAGQFFGNMFMSRLSDKVGRKIVLVASLAFSALGYVWCVMASNLYHLYLARIFTGIAGGTLPIVQAMVMDIISDPRERPRYFGICCACLGLAVMVGPGVSAGIAVAFGKRASLLSPAIFASLVTVFACFKVHETRPEGGLCGARSPLAAAVHDESLASFRASMAHAVALDKDSAASRSGPVYACAIAMAFASFSFTAMTSMTALTWPLAFNFGPAELGIFFTMVGALGIFVNGLVVQRLISKWGAETLALALSLALAVGISMYTFVDLIDPGNMLMFVPYLVFFATFITVPFYMHLPTMAAIVASNVAPDRRGSTTGLLASGMSLGFTLCPFTAGALFNSDMLRLEHAYGSFSHATWVICGLLNVLEFILLAVVVGRGKKSS